MLSLQMVTQTPGSDFDGGESGGEVEGADSGSLAVDKTEPSERECR